MENQHFGIYDRFPPGEAWFDSVHTIGQLGYAKNTQNQTTFYSSAQFSTVNNRNRTTMNPSQMIVQRQIRQAKEAERL